MQTSGANSEHKHSEIQHFSTLDRQISQKIVIVNMSISSVTCTNQSLKSVVSTSSRLAFNSSGPTMSARKWNTNKLKNVTNGMCVKTAINVQLKY